MNRGSPVNFFGALQDEINLTPWFLGRQVFGYPARIGARIPRMWGDSLSVAIRRATENHNPEIQALVDGQNRLLGRHEQIGGPGVEIKQAFTGNRLSDAMDKAVHLTVLIRFTMTNLVRDRNDAIRRASGYHEKACKSRDHSSGRKVTIAIRNDRE